MTSASELRGEAPRRRVVYDGDCGLCRTFAGAVNRRAGGELEFLPLGEVVAPPLERARDEILLIEPDGRILGGADAVARILRQLPAGAVVGRWLALPGVRRAAAVAYRWLARRRRPISRLLRLDEAPNPGADSEYQTGSTAVTVSVHSAESLDKEPKCC